MINKIVPISFTANKNINHTKKTKIEISYPQHNSLNFNKTNLNIINFKAKEFYKTLEENYFQLPQGAKPDVFQKAAARNILENNDVIVTAPTGTGKTAIALYAITKNMQDGVKTFYTTPLKALSNEKYRNFQKIFGKENVGLLTGDTKANINAPNVVMTTEVYRNMVMSDRFNHDNKMLDNLKTVIFDELHYLGDADRGGIWEQSIILSNPKTQLLSLSATIGNNKDVANWMANTKNHQKAEIVAAQNRNMETYTANNKTEHTVLIDVPSENRHVPLHFEVLPVTTDIPTQNEKPVKNKKTKKSHMEKSNIETPQRIPTPSLKSYQKMVEKLKKENKIPAIFFVFSKRGSNAILRHLTKFGLDLNNQQEKNEISKIIKTYKKDGKYLGESLNYRALEKGYAIHNAGLLPTQKELIEELFNKKLVKVVIATETLSAGINMPARTTVITSDRTPTGGLNPNKFHQMAGRAGRRGIDEQGYCICMSVSKEQGENFKNLIQSPPNNLESAFKPDFSFVANYYETFNNDKLINELFEKSFYAYDNNPQIRTKKSKEMKEFFTKRKTILRKMDYLKSNNQLTHKGELLAKLNGYEQLPIINAIYSKELGNMTPVEFVAAVGTLANIQQKFENGLSKKNTEIPFSHSNIVVEDFVSKFNDNLKNYNKELYKYDNEYKPVEIDSKATLHLYEWANLNSKSEDSIENWKSLYHGDLSSTIKNEGSVFKEITMTIDLLKQMKEIAKIGMEFSDDKADYQYYNKLSHNIDEALTLICKTPIDV